MNTNAQENVEHIGWDKLDKRKYYIFGPACMFGVRLIIFPPILIKTRLQVQNQAAVYNGTFDAFKKIFKAEGIRGFYKGFLTSNLTIISGQVYITAFEIVRNSLPSISQSSKSLVSGFCASLAGQLITVPIDVISQKQMMEGQKSHLQKSITNPKTKPSYKSAWSVTSDIYRTNGVRGFYKGFLVSLMTYAPSSAIWWTSYYNFTQFWSKTFPSETPILAIQGLSGPCASIVAALCTNPIDTVRTRLQVEGGTSTFGAVAIKLYKEEGIYALRKGLTARLTSSVPAGFIIIVGYETVKKISLKDEYRSEYSQPASTCSNQ